MRFDVTFHVTNQSFTPQFDKVLEITDGGYDKGYAAGYETGNAEGYTKGYGEGLAAREYETWTITLTDGTIIEKEVALL